MSTLLLESFPAPPSFIPPSPLLRSASPALSEYNAFDISEAYGGVEDDGYDSPPLSARFPIPPPLSAVAAKRLSLVSISMHDLPADDNEDDTQILSSSLSRRRPGPAEAGPSSRPHLQLLPAPSPRPLRSLPKPPLREEQPQTIHFPITQEPEPLLVEEKIEEVHLPGPGTNNEEEAYDHEDALALHRQFRSARSTSTNHKKRLRSLSKPDEPPASITATSPIPLPRASSESNRGILFGKRERAVTGPPPSSFRRTPVTPPRPRDQDQDDRPSSPDVETLIDKTPRPRRSSSRFSNRSRVSLSRKTSISSFGSHGGERGGKAVSEDSDSSELSLLQDGTGAGEDSDSSLDVKTPLPHLLLRDGVLSHKSKLIESASTPTPGEGTDGRMSEMSLRSTDSSISLLKDVRDTRHNPIRRLRHKDGKTLRGGLGLTTGLGWSDSEDEDAPSPLTKRVSKTVLERKGSIASIGLGRSTSSLSLNSSRNRSRSYGNLRSAPPSISSTPMRRSTLSNEVRRNSTVFEIHGEDELEEEDDYVDDTFRGYGYHPGPSSIPSDNSTFDGLPPRSLSHRYSTNTLNKTLPPLPNPRTGSIRRPAAPGLGARFGSKGTRTTTTTVGGSAPTTPIQTHTTAMNDLVTTNASPSPSSASDSHADDTIPRPPKSPGLRQLQLPRARGRYSSQVGLIPIPPTPSSRSVRSTSTTSTATSISTPATPRTPTTPMSPGFNGKPRTGTGMVYRKSSGSNGHEPKSLLRMPSTPSLRGKVGVT